MYSERGAVISIPMPEPRKVALDKAKTESKNAKKRIKLSSRCA